MNIYLNCGWKKAAIELLSLFKKEGSGTVKAARTWESFNLTDEVVFQRHNLNLRLTSQAPAKRQMHRSSFL
jgi:hypothetical protein